MLPTRRPARLLAAATITTLATAGVLAAAAGPALAAPASLPGLINSLRLWLTGLLAVLATLFLTIGGVRYLAAGGDPGQVERAKNSLRSAAVGYALAALAPVLVGVLRSLFGN